ncbi:hypothetical protein ACHQM5_012532 [Ranunculus cassubicifolius]
MLLTLICFLLSLASFAIGSEYEGFTYNGFQNAPLSQDGVVQIVTNGGFQNATLSLDGVAEIETNGLLKLTNPFAWQYGHAFYSKPFKFKKTPNASALSFSTTFVFTIVQQYPSSVINSGIAFLLTPSKDMSEAPAGQFFDIFSNHVISVEFYATVYEFSNISIYINDSQSVILSAPASYFLDDFRNLSLASGKQMQVWIEYDGLDKLLNVTIAPIHLRKPKIPLLSLHRDISPVLLESMYVGFSSSSIRYRTSLQYTHILGWSFQLNGQAQALDLSHLPSPRLPPKKQSKVLTIELPVILSIIVLTFILGTILLIRRKRKLAVEVEDWELSYGGQRRPIAPRASDENIILVDWVINCRSKGNIFETTDPNLGSNYVKEEMEIVLNLGLLCSHNIAASRPSMRQVVQILANDITLSELSSCGLSSENGHGGEGFNAFAFSGLEESLPSRGR